MNKDKKTQCGQNAGVSCDVTNCHYHCGEYGCKAEQIKVGHGFAANSADTVCDTFKPKSID